MRENWNFLQVFFLFVSSTNRIIEFFFVCFCLNIFRVKKENIILEKKINDVYYTLKKKVCKWITESNLLFRNQFYQNIMLLLLLLENYSSKFWRKFFVCVCVKKKVRKIKIERKTQRIHSSRKSNFFRPPTFFWENKNNTGSQTK